MGEQEFRDFLKEAIYAFTEGEEEASGLEDFEATGFLTRDTGFVIVVDGSEFTVTIHQRS